LTVDGQVLERRVVPPAELGPYLEGVARRFRGAGLALGDRTGARDLARQLEAEGIAERLGGIIYVDEHLSSVEGRQRYWKSRPPRGWRRLVPVGMLTPPEPYDGWVAEVIARRFLERRPPDKEG